MTSSKTASRINGKQNPEYYKAYYQKNRERHKEKCKERYLKARSTPEGLILHQQKATEATRRYRIRHPERVKELRKKLYNNRKVRAMELLGGAKCTRCGCNEIEFLEFNHKNGGGCKDIRGQEKYRSMVDRILMGKRETDDLEVLCRVCNALDYLERKNKEGAKHFQIKWML